MELYGILSKWYEWSVVWYGTFEEARKNATTGDILIVKIMEA